MSLHFSSLQPLISMVTNKGPAVTIELALSYAENAISSLFMIKTWQYCTFSTDDFEQCTCIMMMNFFLLQNFLPQQQRMQIMMKSNFQGAHRTNLNAKLDRAIVFRELYCVTSMKTAWTGAMKQIVRKKSFVCSDVQIFFCCSVFKVFVLLLCTIFSLRLAELTQKTNAVRTLVSIIN